jgi:threonine dehydrogenase-like Zn-dependent dehydrogenase
LISAFRALEYTSENTFIESDYRFTGSIDEGWTITRNGKMHLKLGPGYRLLQTVYCGICSTDLARRLMPFPLPQIIGHETVARDPATGSYYVIEINDTCAARGEKHPEIFCRSGLPTHCPARMVLGIDRLPGGFGPWILAPKNAAVPIQSLPARAAVLVEPFASALHAATVSAPCGGSRVAVVGPGRLGLLLIAALSSRRKTTGVHFDITALSHSGKNLDLARILGADRALYLSAADHSSLHERFDHVFDATGSPEGFETSLMLARKEVHLKSTSGQEFHGIRHLTELVVDELSLLPFSTENLEFHWNGENRNNQWVFISPEVALHDLPEHFKTYRGDFPSADSFLQREDFRDRLPRFDISIASSTQELDGCIRPVSEHERSLIRPRGAILWKGPSGNNPLLDYLNSGKLVRTSRCGDFREAIQILEENSDILSLMERHIISHEFPANKLAQAFEMAKSAESIKVIIKHDNL